MMGPHAALRALAVFFTTLVLTTLALPAAATPPRYAAVLKVGQGARPPHCAVTGWTISPLPCPKNTVCRVSSVSLNASVSNCVAVPYKSPTCSLTMCARAGGDALCEPVRGVLRAHRIRCRELENRICNFPVACDPVHGDLPRMQFNLWMSRGRWTRPREWVPGPPGPPVCDSTGVKWANRCALLRGLCRRQFLDAQGPVPGKC